MKTYNVNIIFYIFNPGNNTAQICDVGIKNIFVSEKLEER